MTHAEKRDLVGSHEREHERDAGDQENERDDERHHGRGGAHPSAGPSSTGEEVRRVRASHRAPRRNAALARDRAVDDDGAMLHVFEVFVAPESEHVALLSDEILRETLAQVMTPAEARAVGFSGFAEDGENVVRLIAVHEKDARWVQRAIETNDAIVSFRVHLVDA